MKKVFLITMMLVCIMFVQAQNYEVLHVEQDESGDYAYCMNVCDGVIIYAQANCPSFEWWVGDEYLQNVEYITLNSSESSYNVSYSGCGIGRFYSISFYPSEIANPFAESIVWKHQGESIMLNTGYDGLWHYWSNGSIESQTDIVTPGNYTVTITDSLCLYQTFSVEVRDNVELYHATVDLETNLNKATWQVTAAQAEYISEVKVYRDGLLVGIAPYEQGYYLDAIGSDNAARNYQIVGVSIEGEDCPIPSYQKGTIHTTYYQDVNNNLNMTWNIPYVEEGAQGTLTYFQICKYDPNTSELTVVDQVNSSITDYTCGVNQFDGGYAVIAAVFNNGKDFEELSFSNLTTDILGLDENGENAFRIYPNPAKDRVTIEGTGTAIITNALGQTILTRDINGKEIIELPQGLYFVEMNGVTRKVVVE